MGKHVGLVDRRLGDCAMIVTLLTVTFIGEAVREAFDPKLHTVYE